MKQLISNYRRSIKAKFVRDLQNSISTIKCCSCFCSSELIPIAFKYLFGQNIATKTSLLEKFANLQSLH